MTMSAEALGKTNDFAVYDSDIRSLTASLQKNAWDEKVGYFSYVEHDQDGNPEGPLKFKDGSN